MRKPHWAWLARQPGGASAALRSAAMKIAEGKAEIYVETDLKPWDLAPCKVILEEAGGRFTDLTGVPSIYRGTGFASNGRLHETALALLRG